MYKDLGHKVHRTWYIVGDRDLPLQILQCERMCENRMEETKNNITENFLLALKMTRKI